MLQLRKVPKLLGIDYGSKRVGVAVSDDSGSIAFPKTTLANNRALLETLVTLIRNEHVGTVVFGESKNASGADNEIMKDIKRFAGELKNAIQLPVLFEPEFYTSVEARRDIPEGAVDAQAAAILLNSYINRTKKHGIYS